MPGENLTRIEAQERRAIVDTESYEIALDLTKGAEVFGSRSVVRFTATEGSSTFIDLIAREVREITLNGEQIDPISAYADSRIALDGLAADAAVFGVPSEEWGEAVHAVVAPRPGHQIDIPSLEAHADEHLAGYKRPRSWEVRESLPRTESGKLLKRVLRDEHWKGRDQKV